MSMTVHEVGEAVFECVSGLHFSLSFSVNKVDTGSLAKGRRQHCFISLYPAWEIKTESGLGL